MRTQRLPKSGGDIRKNKKMRREENGGGGGIRTPGTLRHAGFQDRFFKPLRHPSSKFGRSGGIRTPDIQLPKLAHYQAVQRSVFQKMFVILSKFPLRGNCKQTITTFFRKKPQSKGKDPPNLGTDPLQGKPSRIGLKTGRSGGEERKSSINPRKNRRPPP